jgi:hypothetical protein
VVHVRLATPEDADAIATLALEVQDWHVAGRPDIFRPGGYDLAPEITARIRSDHEFYWVAILDGVTIGWAFNTSARRFYERLGFTPFHERMSIDLPADDTRDPR